MPRTDVEVTVTTLTPLEEPERGWCEPCGLPSLLSWHVAFELGRGVTLATMSLCPDCGAEGWVA